MSIGMDALLPRDDPAPFFFVMVGVTSRHLLACRGILDGVLEPFFLEVFLVILCFCSVSELLQGLLRESNKCECF